MKETVVDRIHQEFSAIALFLREKNEISFELVIDEYFRKSLLLSVASLFEHVLTESVHSYCVSVAKENKIIPALVRNKVISRHYHTWFDWKDSNANSFFGMFGDDFKSQMKIEVVSNQLLQTSIKDFLELGRDRNRLVHENFGSFSLEKTADEIYAKYKSASYFAYSLPILFGKAA